MPGVMGGVILHVEGLDDGTLTEELTELLVFVDLAAEDFELPEAEESAVEVFGGLAGVGGCEGGGNRGRQVRSHASGEGKDKS